MQGARQWQPEAAEEQVSLKQHGSARTTAPGYWPREGWEWLFVFLLRVLPVATCHNKFPLTVTMTVTVSATGTIDPATTAHTSLSH